MKMIPAERKSPAGLVFFYPAVRKRAPDTLAKRRG